MATMQILAFNVDNAGRAGIKCMRWQAIVAPKNASIMNRDVQHTGLQSTQT